MDKALKAVREASISIACLLDDVSVNKSEEINLSELHKDIEHIQDQITILENYLEPFVIEELNNSIADKYQAITSDNADYFVQGEEDERNN